jgi:hypothetical protein
VLLAAATSTYRSDFEDRHQSTGVRYRDFISALLSGRVTREHLERLPKRFKRKVADAEGKTIDDLYRNTISPVECTAPLGKRPSIHATVERTLVRWVLARTESQLGAKAKTRWLLFFASELARPGANWISFEPKAFALRMAGDLILPLQAFADLGAVFLRTYEPKE